MSFVLRWLWAFVFTQLVETGIYVQALPGRPTRERFAIALGASGITHPIVWFVIPDIGNALGLSWWPTVAIAETFAVVVEGLWLAAFGVRRGLAWSLFANGVSFSLGLVGYALLGW
ncbi:MAG: hypothetical protein U0234_28375 [Sandaracinus sp.]